MKKKRGIYHAGIVPAILMLILLSGLAMASADEKAVHPELSEQEMLVACSDCHRDATPAIEKEWYDSVHGIAMVKCYQCHGSYETFAVTPTVQNCATCHTVMLEEKHSKGKLCWECHEPHTFKEKE